MAEKLQDRYLVIKHSDIDRALVIGRVSVLEVLALGSLTQRIVESNIDYECLNPTRRGVYIEADWPQYKSALDLLDLTE